MNGAFVHAGHGHWLPVGKVLVVAVPSSAPIQRVVRAARKTGDLIDLTSGRRSKSAVFVSEGKIVLLAITPKVLAGRVAMLGTSRTEEDDDGD